MLSRIFQAPKSSFFLFGARGTGKSTLLQTQFPKAHTIDLFDERKFQSYLADIGSFYDELSALPKKSEIIVDEIQRLPQLLNECQRLIVGHGHRMMLSGSSARKLRRVGVNLLAGRAIPRELYPFVPEELGTQFNLDKVLRQGSLPLVWDSPNPKETLAAYTQTYLKEEIQAEAIVRNLPAFARFLPIAALCHGQILSFSSIARDAEVNRTTVVGFIDILVDTLLAFKLPAFESKLRIREKKKPKFYFIDPGLVRAIKKNLGTLTSEEKGHLFEGWIAQTLRSYQSYRDLFDEWYYWSPAEAKTTEVDFLLKKGNSFIAIESKCSKSLHAGDFKGLKAIAELKNLKRRILVYGGETNKNSNGIEIWSVKKFLDALENSQLF